MDTEHKLPQIETYNKFEQKIKDPLDLDINDRTRSKRETGVPIVIHKMQQANGKERSIMVNEKLGGDSNTP